MRKGYGAKLVFNATGDLVAVATGSDACAEHECGSIPLQHALCTQPHAAEAIVEALRRGQDVTYPRLLEAKRITKHPPGIQFLEIPGPSPQAMFGFASEPLSRYIDELSFPGTIFAFDADSDVVGAWDESSFAIRVRTERYVTALKEFYTAMRAGKVLFAGLFFKRARVRLAGVILANSEHLTPEDLASLESAQRDYESMLRLKAHDESQLIIKEMRRHISALSIGHVWPVWADKQESQVLYRFNPGYQMRAQYGGPYSKEELLAWAMSGGSFDLKPASRLA